MQLCRKYWEVKLWCEGWNNHFESSKLELVLNFLLGEYPCSQSKLRIISPRNNFCLRLKQLYLLGEYPCSQSKLRIIGPCNNFCLRLKTEYGHNGAKHLVYNNPHVILAVC